MICHTEKLEAPVWHVVLGRDLEMADLVHINVLVAIDVLDGVSQTVTQERDAHGLGVRGLVAVQQDTVSTQPATVEGTGDGEDLALGIRGVVDNPALVLRFVVLGCWGHSHVVLLARVGQRGATLLGDEVASLGQVTNDLLVTVLEPEGVGGVCHLLAVGDWGTRATELGLALG